MTESEITEYQIKSQEFTVYHFQKIFDLLTKEVNDMYPKEDPNKLEQLLVVRNILVEQEKKLEDMKRGLTVG